MKDIYGGNAVATLGLPGDLLACSFGKVTRCFGEFRRISILRSPVVQA